METKSTPGLDASLLIKNKIRLCGNAFIAAQIAQVAQLMQFLWAGQLQ